MTGLGRSAPSVGAAASARATLRASAALAAPGAAERGVAGTDFSSTGLAAQLTRTMNAGIHDMNLIAWQTFKFQAGRASYGSGAGTARAAAPELRADSQPGSSRTWSRHSVRAAGARSPLSVPKYRNPTMASAGSNP